MNGFELRSVPKTFYVASRFANWPNVREFATKLEAKGLIWTHDWTQKGAMTPLDDPVAPLLAQREIRAASQTDLFVKLLTDEPSPGAFGELGARLAIGRVAHVIEDGKNGHLFHRHPLVRRYRDAAHFCHRLERYLEGQNPAVWPEDDVNQNLWTRDAY